MYMSNNAVHTCASFGVLLCGSWLFKLLTCCCFSTQIMNINSFTQVLHSNGRGLRLHTNVTPRFAVRRYGGILYVIAAAMWIFLKVTPPYLMSS